MREDQGEKRRRKDEGVSKGRYLKCITEVRQRDKNGGGREGEDKLGERQDEEN